MGCLNVCCKPILNYTFYRWNVVDQFERKKKNEKKTKKNTAEVNVKLFEAILFSGLAKECR